MSLSPESVTRQDAIKPKEVEDKLCDYPIQPRPWMLLAAAALILALSACASNQYMGISFRPGAASEELQELAHRARTGDKEAQLELGKRYEKGQDVRVHYVRAERLYRLAASDTGGVALAYAPAAGGQSYGTVYRLDQGPVQSGLEEARRRLARLRLRLKVVRK